MRRPPLAGLALLCASCSAGDRVWPLPELPDDIELGALVTTDRERSSSLEMRAGASFELEIPGEIPDGSEIFFVGYRRDSIEATGWKDAEHRRVWVASADDALLPPPAFAARALAGDEAPSFTVADPPPEASAAWLPRCPVSAFDEPFSVHTNCDSAPCVIETQINECDVQINLGQCAGLPTLKATMNGRGELDFGPLPSLGRCHSRDFGETEAAPLLSVECTLSSMAHSCRIDLYADEPREYVEDIQRLKLSEVTPVFGTDSGGRPADGYIGGMAFIDGESRLAVAVHERHTSSLCAPRTLSRIALVDPDRVEIIQTATAPDCLRQLVQDPAPGRDGFIAVFRDAPSAGAFAERLGRFDREGRLLESVPLAPPEIDRNAHHLGVLGVQINFDSEAAVFATFEVDADSGQRGYLVRIDPESFETIWVLPTDPKIQDITAMRDQDLGYLEGTNENVFVVNWSGDLQYSYNLTLACAHQSLHPSDFASIYGATPEIIVFGRDRRSATLVVDQQQNCSIVPFFEWPALVSNGHPWPDVRLWVTALEEVGTHRASAALFDPEAARFLPGAWDIGEGSVRIVDWDKPRRIWMTLNDTADLVRMTPIRR